MGRNNDAESVVCEALVECMCMVYEALIEQEEVHKEQLLGIFFFSSCPPTYSGITRNLC